MKEDDPNEWRAWPKMCLHERERAYVTLRAYKLQMESAEIQSDGSNLGTATNANANDNVNDAADDKVNGKTNVEINSIQGKEIIIIDLDDSPQLPMAYASTSNPSTFNEAAYPKFKAEDGFGIQEVVRAEPVAERQKIQIKEEEIWIKEEGGTADPGLSAIRQKISRQTEYEDDEILKLEKEAARAREQFEEAKAIAGMRRRATALEGQLEAAKARKRRGGSSS